MLVYLLMETDHFRRKLIGYKQGVTFTEVLLTWITQEDEVMELLVCPLFVYRITGVSRR